ncbi:MAG: dihydrolipoamide acetyltransferase family protein [Vicinamibacterales bacterium]
MASDVLMPQMGESITEGTIVRWIKQVGDPIDRDEPLFEISTDKVDAEIPSPASGVLTEIRAREGETVPVNSVVAIIEPVGSQPAATPQAAVAIASVPSQAAPVVAAPAVTEAPVASVRPVGVAVSSPEPATPTTSSSALSSTLRHRSSPLVRKIAQEHRVDISQVRGTGIAGRVNKADILSFIASPQRAAETTARTSEVQGRRASHAPASGQTPATGEGLAGQTVPLSVMRRKIAEHMLLSKRTSAHVHTVFEVNYTRIDQIRKARKAEYEAKGGRLTYLSFIVKAVADALQAVPVVNASIDADNNVSYHRQVNIGIAVSLDWGLIVPVVKHADQKDLLGLSRSISDLAERARTKQLKPEDVAGGTFTVTNPGGIGAQFGLPIINQPQVGILGVGTIEKRAVVVDDAIGIRLMGYLALGFDHRVVDGAVGDHFMARIKHQLEHWDPSHA